MAASLAAALLVRGTSAAARPLLGPVLEGRAAFKASVHSSARCGRRGWLAYLMGERIQDNFKPNSKLVVVEGNVATGKRTLAKELAKKLDMLHLPAADVHYWDHITGDRSILDPCYSGICSLEKFLANPNNPDGNAFRLQLWMYTIRMLQYSDALVHLLSTGQGVVLERSLFSDFVFLEAMHKQGYVRKQCVDYYNELKAISICEFLPPHLVVYIDMPVEEVQARLKQKAKPMEQNISPAYLTNIDACYKQKFLPEARKVSEVLEYNWKIAEDTERVYDDIISLNWEKDPWKLQDNVTLYHIRDFMSDKMKVANLTVTSMFVPEATVGPYEVEEIYYSYRNLPGRKYSPGYNADVGDKLIWLK
ncbi:NADH dehydrogenase [ubiquinone] 1 alpha subcomplex subunit 10, mitochondrial [Lethenteron reissneri]|nr:NADH dehydrogenase [ubiquinone] 1 alpha subcomplex subunit 10, mitochondrial [Lethenteron reissneri]